MSQNSDADMKNTSSCRIFTVSSSLALARDVVSRIQGNPDSLTQQDGPENAIPWTIANKYYTADVHFAVHRLAERVDMSAPAIIFVWMDGEPYRQNILQLTEALRGYEPEVTLAIRIPAAAEQGADAEHPEEEDDTEIDEFLSSHGFEFINDAISNNSGTDLYSDGIPGLPRVLDALSTIMWPSMQARGVQEKENRNASHVIAWAQRDSIDRTNSGESLKIDTNTAAFRKKQEIEELARWLQEDLDIDELELVKKDPWKMAASTARGAFYDSPSDDGPLLEEPETIEFGFEDDFTVFVSAPAKEDQDDFSYSPIDSDTSFAPFSGRDDGSLTPGEPSYHSLGSVSDFTEHRDEDIDTDSDLDFPTEDEIRNTAGLIFSEPGSAFADIAGESFDSLPTALDIPRNVDEPEGDEIIGSYEMAPFDLSRVLGVLEGMKTEIAAMDNDNERRKAAARVALGLVYGLESTP